MPFGQPSSNSVIDLLTDVEGASTLAVPGAVTTVYGKSFPLEKNHSYGLIYRFTGTTITVKVELEVGNARPGTEGAADTSWAVAHVLDTAVVASAALAKGVDPVVAKYGRLKLTPSGSNHNDVLLVLAQLGVSKNL